ncbi:Tat pathway signal sequence domain protein [Streptomyces sp. NBC_01381]|uniref:Tat pathway signal sequence domain protein n=1 Tax=Streptomyces sp. NBC_01381 TaxID=2903845 RepID=UPI00225843C1|nr:Tat pathway signal sequence domain protein [Streptomyces sp. NBC_01381]MCX4670811.1 Tat pathway signal sequence domain protein [Streptomyces sp. NBC_01381]
MREIVRRHLGKMMAGAAVAVAATAVMVGVTLPGTAGAGESRDQDRSAAAGAAQQNAVPKDGVVEAAPEEGEKGIGSDPLTDDEMKRAEKIAMGGGDLRRSARDVEGDRGPQLLSNNLSEADPTEAADAERPRRAEIVYYDYKDDALVTRTVNLDTGKVEDTDTSHGVQPPAARDELNEAAQLLIADPLGKDLKSDYKKAMGKELTSPDQLRLSAFVFHKETVEQLPAGLAKCGEHRCLSIVSKVVNGPWIDTRDLIVDLSARTVTRLR